MYLCRGDSALYDMLANMLKTSGVVKSDDTARLHEAAMLRDAFFRAANKSTLMSPGAPFMPLLMPMRRHTRQRCPEFSLARRLLRELPPYAPRRVLPR